MINPESRLADVWDGPCHCYCDPSLKEAQDSWKNCRKRVALTNGSMLLANSVITITTLDPLFTRPIIFHNNMEYQKNMLQRLAPSDHTHVIGLEQTALHSQHITNLEKIFCLQLSLQVTFALLRLKTSGRD